MKELKDIELQKGDVVYFADNTFEISQYSGTIKDYWEDKITKIERPVKYEIIYGTPKQILDKEEKEYLEAVCRPFKNRGVWIKKKAFVYKEYIQILVGKCFEETDLPNFEAGTMYKGMEPDKEYTLKGLGLFEE